MSFVPSGKLCVCGLRESHHRNIKLGDITHAFQEAVDSPTEITAPQQTLAQEMRTLAQEMRTLAEDARAAEAKRAAKDKADAVALLEAHLPGLIRANIDHEKMTSSVFFTKDFPRVLFSLSHGAQKESLTEWSNKNGFKSVKVLGVCDCNGVTLNRDGCWCKLNTGVIFEF